MPLAMIAAAARCAAGPRCFIQQRSSAVAAWAQLPFMGLRGKPTPPGASCTARAPAASLRWGVALRAGAGGARALGQGTAAPARRGAPKTIARMAAAAGSEDTGLWADAGTTFAGLGLGAELVDALGQLGFSRPTRIQAATLPAILAGKDVVMGAETGSGKVYIYKGRFHICMYVRVCVCVCVCVCVWNLPSRFLNLESLR